MSFFATSYEKGHRKAKEVKRMIPTDAIFNNILLAKELMQFPNANKLRSVEIKKLISMVVIGYVAILVLLMLDPSRKRAPTLLVVEARSEPAKSIKVILPIRTFAL